MYDTILVPTDGSEGAEAAARHALALANAFDSDLRFLSVVDDRSSSSGFTGLDSLADEQRDVLDEGAAENLRSLEALATDAAIPFESTVEHGIPHRTILDHADEHDADLVAMGTHGRTGLQRVFVGSVTERVVRTSDVPVFTTRAAPDEDAGYGDVLIPTDGSDAASAAVEHGLAVADRYDGTVHALSVVDLSSITGSYDTGSIVKAWKSDCEQAVAEIADAAEDRGIDVVTEVGQSTPYRAIERYVNDQGIDLVTMGTHGRTGLERYLVGSVTARTVRTSDVPVLTTR
ncbi:universal stress protein [Halococcus dombrowskii]|uniref:Universal stress protein n=1 Tax=Halococcus dombrowskii TaxID=179637 RepID=A0AAV3SBU9_HALDO|nr:universal stress protein [Halococcus dombrowskii]UOO94321.1 universal stress protein [Halococcus dombrowskii]